MQNLPKCRRGIHAVWCSLIYVLVFLGVTAGCSNTTSITATPTVDTNPLLFFPIINDLMTIVPYDKSNGISGYYGTATALGDLTGDGIADLVVGAYNQNYINAGNGTVFVHAGTAAGTFSDLPTIVLQSPSNFGGLLAYYFGHSLKIADVNNDGVVDLLVGATYHTVAGGATGAYYGGGVYIYYGTANAQMDTRPDWIVDDPPNGSDQASNYFGSAIDVADVNGDGFNDLLVGAERDDAAGTDRGAAYLFMGTGTGLPFAKTASLVIRDPAVGSADSDYFGASVAFYDHNGDGSLDILVGASSRDDSPTGVGAGRIFVYYTDKTDTTAPILGFNASPATLAPDAAATTVGGTYINPSASVTTYDQFGEQLQRGDVNGDGNEDLVVGVPCYGSTSGCNIYHGITLFFYGTSTGLSAPESTHDFAITNPGGTYLRFGTGIAVADLNGDGKDDVVIGRPYSEDPTFPTATDTGDVRIYLSGTGTVAGSGDPAQTVYNPALGGANQYFGWRVRAADLDGNGRNELVTSAPLQDTGIGGTNSGGLYVHEVDSNGRISWQPSERVFSGSPNASNQFGYGLDVVDMNGDSVPDFLVGSPAHTGAGGVNEGIVEIMTRGSGGVVSTTVVANPDASANSYFGSSVAGGDLDGDGRADLVVGAMLEDTGVADGGRIYIYLTGGNPLNVSAATQTIDDPDGTSAHNFGSALAIADINNDGLNDIIVGAQGNDTHFANMGAVYFYLNQGSGVFLATASDSIHGPTGEATVGFGYDVSLARINSDDYPDLVVSAPYADDAFSDFGAVYIYFGHKSGGFTNEPSIWVRPDYNSIHSYPSYFGQSAIVANLIGDARADLIVGQVNTAIFGSAGGVVQVFKDYFNF